MKVWLSQDSRDRYPRKRLMYTTISFITRVIKALNRVLKLCKCHCTFKQSMQSRLNSSDMILITHAIAAAARTPVDSSQEFSTSGRARQARWFSDDLQSYHPCRSSYSRNRSARMPCVVQITLMEINFSNNAPSWAHADIYHRVFQVYHFNGLLGSSEFSSSFSSHFTCKWSHININLS